MSRERSYLERPVRRSVVVTFDHERAATKAEIEEFIVEALRTWGGQRHPDDPLFHSLERVRVTWVPR